MLQAKNYQNQPMFHGVIQKINVARYYARWAKKRGTLLLSISSPIIDRFLKFCHWHICRRFQI